MPQWLTLTLVAATPRRTRSRFELSLIVMKGLPRKTRGMAFSVAPHRGCDRKRNLLECGRPEQVMREPEHRRARVERAQEGQLVEAFDDDVDLTVARRASAKARGSRVVEGHAPDALDVHSHHVFASGCAVVRLGEDAHVVTARCESREDLEDVQFGAAPPRGGACRARSR